MRRRLLLPAPPRWSVCEKKPQGSIGSPRPKTEASRESLRTGKDSNAKPPGAGAEFIIGLGIAYYGCAQFDQGAHAFCQASDLAPRDQLPYTFLGKTCQDVSPAIAGQVRAKLRRYMELAPRDATAYYLYALSLWRRGPEQQDAAQLAEVESRLKTAIRLSPQYADAYLQLGQVYSSRGNYSSAIEQYTHALKVSPNLADAHYRLGQALRRAGDAAGAEKEFAVFGRLHKREVAAADRQRNEIQMFVYTMRGTE